MAYFIKIKYKWTDLVNFLIVRQNVHMNTKSNEPTFAEGHEAPAPVLETLPNVSNARILEIAKEEGCATTCVSSPGQKPRGEVMLASEGEAGVVWLPGFEFDHEQLFGFVKRVVDEATTQTWGKAEWRAAAVKVYLADGDDEATAIECARALCREQDWDSEDNLDDPVEAAHEDLRGRRPPVFRDRADSVEPWYAYVPELAVIYGEICAIHETPSKDQTPEQKARLEVLRGECRAVHTARIDYNLLRNREARREASRQSLAAASKAIHPAVAAIEYSLTQGEGDAFLRCWREGDWDTIRKEWPDVPEDVFVKTPAGRGGL